MYLSRGKWKRNGRDLVRGKAGSLASGGHPSRPRRRLLHRRQHHPAAARRGLQVAQAAPWRIHHLLQAQSPGLRHLPAAECVALRGAARPLASRQRRRNVVGAQGAAPHRQQRARHVPDLLVQEPGARHLQPARMAERDAVGKAFLFVFRFLPSF